MTVVLTLERKLALGDKSLCGLLVRVRTITKSHALNGSSELLLGQLRRRILLPEVPTDGLVVRCRHLEGLQRKLVPDARTDIAVTRLPCLEELCVVRRVRKDGHALMVFGCSAQEGDTSDIDLLDRISECAVRLRDSGSEGIEVADDDGNGGDSLRLQVGLVGRDGPSKDA